MCRHFLWGLSQQGMKCQSCGINIHKQCYSLAMEVECVPTKKMIKQGIGVGRRYVTDGTGRRYAMGMGRRYGVGRRK